MDRNFPDSLALAFWQLRADDRRTKAGRLADAGWLGLTACSLSRKERGVLNTFLKTLRRPDYALCHCVTFDDGHPKLGTYRQNQICAWFRKEQAFNDCVAILRSIPTRSVEFVIPEMSKPLAGLLRPLNYRLLRGSDNMLISVEATHTTLQAARDFGE